MLRLQSGRFDAPDRLFGGVAEAWRSASAGPADVKELVPEFFMPGERTERGWWGWCCRQEWL